MLEIASELSRWLDEGRAFAVATVTAVHGSAPRPPGAALAVDAAGTVVGSVSGGCVEGAVYELCREALAVGRPRTERFGYSDADAFATGLTCGGSLDVLITPVAADDTGLRTVLAAALAGPHGALVRSPAGGALYVPARGAPRGSLGGAAVDGTAAAGARALLRDGRTGVLRLPAGEWALVESRVPAPRLLVFGAVDFAAALASAGSFLGYRVTVCDARPVFATPERFPAADEVVTGWPHDYLAAEAAAGRLDARTALCVLTHEAKFDVPLLEAALRLPVAYVGAMGSRRTHTDRMRRLRAAGLTEPELDRLRSPIGLDLGARTPQETALSIAAEIVATRERATGQPLTGLRAPRIHRPAPDRPAG
ncbi:XdhC family protein [Streptomyces carpaticus]|uniref:XdhC family protein n=1 Tax=Streptomyces TaxID=1883 RepID=UPI002200B201|nr:XdhC family protein [Streptomyces carpaticus]